MKISTKGRYSLRLMIDLAEHDNGGYISLKEISERQDISLKYLEQITVPLSKAGLVESVRGANGGYKLAKKSYQYTAGEILRVTEGSLAPVLCAGISSNKCENYDKCSTVDFWKGLSKAINDYVDSITLEDLVNRHIEKTSNNFSI